MLAGLGMSVAVSLLMLFAAGVAPYIAISAVCLFVASLMTWIPLREEHGLLFAIVKFVVVSCGAVLISRTSVWTYLYILMFGAYGIIRWQLCRKIEDRLLTVLIRLLIFNVLAAAGLAFARFVLGFDASTLLPDVPVYIKVPALEVGFLLYMLLYRFFTYFFDSALRSKLLPRR